jgi:uncharacterized membrane protein
MAGEDDHEGGWNSVHRRSQMGEDFSRILSLSDGIFAFAMTLLVIQLTVPSVDCDLKNLTAAQCSSALSGALGAERVVFFGYVLTFLIIGLWWTGHNRVFRQLERFDGALTWLNLLFLLTIAVSPFALGVYEIYSTTRVAVLLFSSVEAASGLLLAAIWWYARHARLIDRHADPQIVHYLTWRSWLSPVAFLLSIPVALADPGVAQYVWFGTFLPFILLRGKFVSRAAAERTG